MTAKTRLGGQHRNSILEAARVACGRALRGRSARSMMLLGLRGTDKIALLSEIGKIAQEEGLLVPKVESTAREILSGNLAHLLYQEIRKVMQTLVGSEYDRPTAKQGLQALSHFTAAPSSNSNGMAVSVEPEPGLADLGDLQYDLPEIFASIGRTTQAIDKGWLLLIDDMHHLSRNDLAALMMAIHRTNQEGLPVLLIGTGLPKVARLAGDAKPYAERLFLYLTSSPS